ncbi:MULTISPECIES: ribonuclease P protein component [unclassified Acidovorax]|uniref:ribonuclease P protein component n=1 Tax=unclassified Acidovorax TaxID=2684926 RepID=UPI002882DB17|nr:MULTISPECIES: ribonuclease P protein component [unclassified Acidovorax]
MHRLKTRPQFQAAMAGGTVSRTAHFALHRLGLEGGGSTVANSTAASPSTGPGPLPTAQGPQALFGVVGGQLQGPWMGAMVPKRWARRAVTRNAIKRQIHAVAATFEAQLPVAAHVVRLRSTFDRKQFLSATSDELKRAVRAELLQLFTYAVRRSGADRAASTAAPAAVPMVSAEQPASPPPEPASTGITA